MIKSFERLLFEAKKTKGIVVGVPYPHDLHSIQTVIQARREGIADFILCGDPPKISEMLRENGADEKDFKIAAAETEERSAGKIVELANKGEVHVILKGFLPTGLLMKPILDKEKGLRTGGLLSDILLVENPLDNFEGFLGMTDGGLNILPDLQQKKQIIENAVSVYHKLGYENPRVGLLAASEKVSEAMPATVDARALTEMNRKGEISGCEVYGPLALDIAVSARAAAHKGITHPVAGCAQILVVPNIEVGNIFGKAFTYYLKVQVGHVVMGAKIPILIPSRNESEGDKINSVAMGVLCADC
jgi:phosphate butyryltransferase